MTKRINTGVNKTIETWLTRGVPFIRRTNAKGVSLGLPIIPIAGCESIEFSQANTTTSLTSYSEEQSEIVRRLNTGKEITGTMVYRDLKPEVLEMIQGGTLYIDPEVSATYTHKVVEKKKGDYILFEGFANFDDFVIMNDTVALVEDVDYILNDGYAQLIPESTKYALNDDLSITYTKREQRRIEASTVDNFYGEMVFIGHRLGEDENTLYKVTMHLGVFDPSTFVAHSPEDFASETTTIGLVSKGRGRGLSSYITTVLANEDITPAV